MTRLAEPFTLPSGLTLTNRIAKAAMTENLADADNHAATVATLSGDMDFEAFCDARRAGFVSDLADERLYGRAHQAWRSCAAAGLAAIGSAR